MDGWIDQTVDGWKEYLLRTISIGADADDLLSITDLISHFKSQEEGEGKLPNFMNSLLLENLGQLNTLE